MSATDLGDTVIAVASFSEDLVASGTSGLFVKENLTKSNGSSRFVAK